MNVEHLVRADAEEAIATLCAAFYEYPVMRYTLADAGADYDRRLRALIGFFCNKRLVQGWPVLGCRIEGRIGGVALVNEPGQVPDAAAAEKLRGELLGAIGEDALTRLQRYEDESDLDAPCEPHHFLGVLGVHPDLQGSGLARPLLEEVAAMSHRHSQSTGVCLNTEDPDNVPFYEHMGYRTLACRTIDTLETWCMFRPSTDA